MKHLSFPLSDKKALKQAKKESKKTVYKSQLIQIFTAQTDKKKIQKILLALTKSFPEASIIGTTTAGEISHATMYDDSTVISLSLFNSTKLITQHVNKITKKSGQKISSQICSKNTKAAIVISEGLKGADYEGFIKGIKKENSNLIISGGLAGDNFKLKETFIFLGKKIYDCGAVAVSFSGKDLFADNEYNLNWTPIGKEFTITKVEQNRVIKIDDMGAVSLFKKYLGEAIFADEAAALPDFQLLYKEGSTTVARTPMAVDGEALLFAGPIKEGQQVQFGFSNASAVVSGSNSISKNLLDNPAEAIYIYSCIARKTLLGKTLEHEFKAFENIAPTAGFFTYGEFYSTTANNALLNCTTTILVLSESSKKAKQKTKDQGHKKNNLDTITFNALTHFVEQTAEELESHVKLLNQYKSIVDKSSLVSKTDKNGIITYVNDNFVKISGYAALELIGSSHSIVRDPSVSSFTFKKMWQTLLSKKIWRGVLSNRAKDGSIYHIEATIMPILSTNGDIEEFIAIRQDITKQVLSKKRLKEKERLIKAIFDNQDSIVIFTSKTDGMLNVNKKLFEYLNFKSFDEFREKHFCICELFLEEEGYVSLATHPEWIEEISSNEGTQDYKVKMMTNSGLIHTFKLLVKRVDTEYIVNLYDITSLENALQKAHLSEQAKSTFLSNMSHEIRTPLNGILGFTDILSKKGLDKDVGRYVEIINKSGHTLLNIVNDILDFSKIESGELSLYKTDSNMFEEMEGVVAIFSSLSKQKYIEYYTYIDPSIPKTLLCDIQRVKQVMNNLISNAMKFTPSNGSVSVSIGLKKLDNKMATIEFSVKDSGIGIEEKKISTIFKAFSQADNSISREYGGTGLGLAISNKYINMMGSEIQVQSKQNAGSNFHFSIDLPVVDSSCALNNETGFSSLNIAILYSQEEDFCSVNENATTYLNAWGAEHRAIYSLDDVNNSTNALIICAKLFDKELCLKTLNKYESLELIYLEGIEDDFNCSHERFHLIEQPLTGSALFDKLITLSSCSLPSKDTVSQQPGATFEGSVLIAEDNLTNQMLISVMLDERQTEYKVVNNGQEALDELQNAAYDLILMDINMPILDGVSATKMLRSQDYDKPIVSLSANVIASDIASFREAGVDDILYKPLVPKELDRVLRKYLQEKSKNIEFDRVDVASLSQSLAIENETIILKLLKSFYSSTQKIISTLESQNLDAELAHNIKGTSANLRFEHVYALVSEFEESLELWGEKEHKENKELLLKHLYSLLEQIELLNK